LTKIEGDLVEVDKVSIIRKSVFALREKNVIPSLEQFILLLNENLTAHFSGKKAKYFVATTMSARCFPLIEILPFTINHSTVSIRSQFPEDLKTSPWSHNGFEDVQVGMPLNYARFTVELFAHSDHQAAINGIENLEIVLAALNFAHREGRDVIYTGRTKPRADFHLGPHQIVYRADGEPVRDFVYYEPDFEKVVFPHELTASIVSRARSILDRIQRAPLRRLLIAALQLYGRAMLRKDQHLSMLELWSCLEILTDSSREKNEITIRRASSLSRDRDLMGIILKQVAGSRNDYVHRGDRDPVAEARVRSLKFIVEEIFLFICFADRPFKEIRDLVRFLSLPNSAERLQTEYELIELAFRVRGIKSPTNHGSS
jgi:hypothetical protein